MIKIATIFNILFLYSQVCLSQAHSSIARHIIYAEGCGIGGYGSLNYENVFFGKGLFRMSARAGISTYRVVDFENKFNPDLIVPFAVYAMLGKTHYAEIGLGQTVSSIVQINPETFKAKRSTDVHANFSVAYRYQRNKGGVFLRLSYSPLIERYKAFRHWGGLSLGYAFKGRKKQI